MFERSVTPTLPTRVLCVDDSADITLVMKMVIGTDAGLEFVGCLGSADQLIEKVKRMNPHVVVLDATMPGKDPLVVMKEMSAECPDVRTIIYSGHADQAFLERIRDAGAWGFVSKNDEADAILKAVHAVAAGNVFWPGAKR